MGCRLVTQTQYISTENKPDVSLSEQTEVHISLLSRSKKDKKAQMQIG